MKVNIRQIENKTEEQVIIECVAVNHEVERIKAFVLAAGTLLTGVLDERSYQVELSDVYYFEAVDERVFAYTKDNAYELKIRLYELEQVYVEHHFVRTSKSFLINLMKLQSIRPALNGRFTAEMKNGEEIIISRQYVPTLKTIVQGGKTR